MIHRKAHIQDYLQVMMRRKGVILTFFSVLVVTVLIGSLRQMPLYRATTTLLIEHRSPRVVSVQEVSPMGPSGVDYRTYKDYYETQYKLMKSYSLLKRVSDTLDLRSHGPYKKGGDPVKKLMRFVKVTPVRTSQLVEVSADDPSPEMAARITNTVANEYINQNLERNVGMANNAAEWLAKRIEEQRQNLMDAELALQAYRKKYDVNVLPQLTGDRAIEDVKAEYATLQALLANYNERYTDEHPKMIELKAQTQSLRNKIHGMEDGDAGDRTMEYTVLERDVQTNRRMYELLLARLKEIDVSSTLDVNNISIIDMAKVPVKPVKPNMKLNMVLAVMIGLVIGTGLGFFIDYLDTTIKSPEDIRDLLGLRFLGGVPKVDGKEEAKKDKIVHLDPASPIAETYRHIRTEMLYSVPKETISSAILVTSAEPQAGKTMTSTNISIALSQMGQQVLLVDADLRKPQLHKIFNLNRTGGLSEYLKGVADVDLVAKKTGIDNLKVVTAGKDIANPAEAMGSKRMADFIAEAKQKYDFIVFDSPPVASVTDAVVLSDMVDGLIQVIRSGKILVPLALRVKEKLANAKAPMLGAILNDMKTSDSEYYHNYRYYRYYGDTKGAKNTEEVSLKGKARQLVESVKQKRNDRSSL